MFVVISVFTRSGPGLSKTTKSTRTLALTVSLNLAWDYIIDGRPEVMTSPLATSFYGVTARSWCMYNTHSIISRTCNKQWRMFFRGYGTAPTSGRSWTPPPMPSCPICGVALRLEVARWKAINLWVETLLFQKSFSEVHCVTTNWPFAKYQLSDGSPLVSMVSIDENAKFPLNIRYFWKVWLVVFGE
jgi:hypothetical protein